MTSDRLIFFGTADYSRPSLEALIEAGFKIVAVVTKPDKPVGRHSQPQAPSVKLLADEHKIPVLQPAGKLTEILPELKDLKPDAGVVVAYGRIIPPEILAIFPKGLINAHASLLPLYRGASPIEAALLNGDKNTGVTLMAVEEGMDTGKTFCQAEIKLMGNETRPELYQQMSKLSAQMFVECLPQIMAGQLVPKSQQENDSTSVSLIKKADGAMDWNKSAEQLEREVRAYLGWPGSQTRLFDRELTITAAHAVNNSGKAGSTDTSGGQLIVFCGEGALAIDRLKPAGKREMSAAEFLAGLHL